MKAHQKQVCRKITKRSVTQKKATPPVDKHTEKLADCQQHVLLTSDDCSNLFAFTQNRAKIDQNMIKYLSRVHVNRHRFNKIAIKIHQNISARDNTRRFNKIEIKKFDRADWAGAFTTCA